MDAEVSEALRYARLIRPFPVKRLHDRVLFQVLTTAHGIQNTVTGLLIDQPTDPDTWTAALWKIGGALEDLANLCDQAAPLVELMVEEADGQYARSIDAMTRVLQGIAAAAAAEGAVSL